MTPNQHSERDVRELKDEILSALETEDQYVYPEMMRSARRAVIELGDRVGNLEEQLESVTGERDNALLDKAEWRQRAESWDADRHSLLHTRNQLKEQLEAAQQQLERCRERMENILLDPLGTSGPKLYELREFLDREFPIGGSNPAKELHEVQ